MRHARLVGRARHGEVGDILLQREGDGRVGHAAEDVVAGGVGVVESVAHVEAVERRRDGEEVGVGFVAVRFVEVEGVAGEDQLGDEGGGAVEVVGVALGLRAVEYWWVEGFCDVGEDFGVGLYGGDDGGELSLDVGGILDVGRCEGEALKFC